MRAAAIPYSSVEGTFKLTIKATGEQDGMVYLNSERDYRDQRNLCIEVTPEAQEALQRKFGVPAIAFFKGKEIAVHGFAHRVTIAIYDDNGHRIPTHYFQTHVQVRNVDQITLL